MDSIEQKILEIVRKSKETEAEYSYKVLAADELSERQITNALSGFAKGCSKYDIVCMVDTTSKNTGEEGILFSSDAVYSHFFMKDKALRGPVRYADIESAKVKDKPYDISICINGKTCTVFTSSVYSYFICKALTDISELLRSQKTGNGISSEEAARHCEWAQRYYDSKDYEAALSLFEQAADGGIVAAMNQCGLMYFQGQGTAKDAGKAFRYFRKAVAAGSTDSMNNIGFMYYYGNGVVQDYSEALSWFRKAADAGNVRAAFNCGVLFKNGQGTAKDLVSALSYLKKAEAGGYAKASKFVQDVQAEIDRIAAEAMGASGKAGQASAEDLYRRANELYDEGKYDQVIPLLKLAIEGGSADAEGLLGDCYYYGRGAEKDLEESVRWYRSASNHGSITATYNLGYAYYFGKGAAVDLNAGFQLFLTAAQKGLPVAQNRLGEIYQDRCRYPDAEKWLLKAAEGGNKRAYRNLGSLYSDENSGLFNEEKALSWYKKAAEAGDLKSMQTLGYVYSHGDFYRHGKVAKSGREALKWYTMAADTGSAEDMENVALIYRNGREGIPRDFSKAIDWYIRLSQKWYSAAMTGIGDLYSAGDSTVPRNYSKAYEYYKKAADMGYKDAMAGLGDLLCDGDATLPVNPDEAAEWYKKALYDDPHGFIEERTNKHANLGLGDVYRLKGDGKTAFRYYSMYPEIVWFQKLYGLGCLYYDGNGVERDRARAKELFEEIVKKVSSGNYDDTDISYRKAREALNSWDFSPPAAKPAAVPSFRMKVEDTFTITGKGTVLIGKVETGTLLPDDEVEIIRAGSVKKRVTVQEIRNGRQTMTSASAGDEIDLILTGVGKADVSRGDIIAHPGMAEKPKITISDRPAAPASVRPDEKIQVKIRSHEDAEKLMRGEFVPIHLCWQNVRAVKSLCQAGPDTRHTRSGYKGILLDADALDRQYMNIIYMLGQLRWYDKSKDYHNGGRGYEPDYAVDTGSYINYRGINWLGDDWIGDNGFDFKDLDLLLTLAAASRDRCGYSMVSYQEKKDEWLCDNLYMPASMSPFDKEFDKWWERYGKTWQELVRDAPDRRDDNWEQVVYPYGRRVEKYNREVIEGFGFDLAE